MAVAVLSSEARRYTVMALACYDTPTEVQRQLKTEFGIDVSRQAVQRHDPTSANGESLSAALKKLFYATRKRFVDEIEQQPMGLKSVRLRRINHLYEQAQDAGNPKLAARAIDLSIKEMRPVKSDDDAPDSEAEEIWNRLMGRASTGAGDQHE